MGVQVTVNDVLDGHVAHDIHCLDRIYLNVYIPRLQTSAQVVAFLSAHLGYPAASLASSRCCATAGSTSGPRPGLTVRVRPEEDARFLPRRDGRSRPLLR